MEINGTMVIAGLTTLFAVSLLFVSLFVSGRGGLPKSSVEPEPPEPPPNRPRRSPRTPKSSAEP